MDTIGLGCGTSIRQEPGGEHDSLVFFMDGGFLVFLRASFKNESKILRCTSHTPSNLTSLDSLHHDQRVILQVRYQILHYFRAI